MFLAVFRSGLVLATILIVDVYSICLLSRQCPCGTSGKSYIRCFETVFQQYSCESWINCQTCEDYNQFCVTCPPGRSGLTCKNETKVKPELSCKHPGVVENGIIEDFQSETDKFPVGIQLRFLCREGYERKGPEAIYCLRNLLWSETPPVCKQISTDSTLTSEPSCERPVIIENGVIQNDVAEMQSFPIGSILSFKCMEGYELIGASVVYCLRSGDQLGYWSDIPPLCRYIHTTTKTKRDLKRKRGDTSYGLPQFGPLPSLLKRDNKEKLKKWEFEELAPEFTDTGKECTFQITGSNSFNCSTDKDRKVSCDVTCNDKQQGRYHCLPGMGWDRTLPSCETPKEPNVLSLKKKMATCSDPGTPSNAGRRNLDGHYIRSRYTFKEGDVVVYFCNDRKLTLQGSSRLTCQPEGSWDDIPPLCVSSQNEVKVKQKLSCKHPGVVENGIIEDFQSDTEQFPVGTHLKFLCREGYEREGPLDIYCLRNLSWSGDIPVCKLILTTTESTPASIPFCERPGTIENGFIQNDVAEMQTFPVNSVLSFKCMKGYELIGANVLHCLRSDHQLGYWSDVPPLCRYIPTTTTPRPIERASCPNPGMVENGIFENYPPETISFPLGTDLKFQCMEGYEMEGSEYVYCILPGIWSGSLPNCRLIPTTPVPEVFCGHPGMVANGMFEGMSQSLFPLGTPLTFLCRPGSQMEGHRNIYCLRGGKWSASPPTCRTARKGSEKVSRLTCNHPGMIENGVNEPSASNSEVFTAGQRLKFKCKEGHTMEGSDTIHCESSGQWSSAPPVCRRPKNIADCGRVFQEVYKSTRKHTRSDWPWTVGLSIGNEDDVEKMFCGGALLDSRTVLTAAHCVTTAQNIKLHFGYRRPISEQVRNISGIIIHPDYDDETHANDIALMKIDHHVYYDHRTQPICLPTANLNLSGKNLIPGTPTYVTGYRLEFATNQSSTPAFKVFELPVGTEEVCEPVCRDQELVSCSPNTFCAGYLKDAKECIYGGTPLAVYHEEKSRYTLEGLVTRAESARNKWNGRCKRAESYTTFTNVTQFMPFILENLN